MRPVEVNKKVHNKCGNEEVPAVAECREAHKTDGVGLNLRQATLFTFLVRAGCEKAASQVQRNMGCGSKLAGAAISLRMMSTAR
jgi:hypothetical protein